MAEVIKLFTLREVSEQTGFALRRLQNDCRAGRLAHVHRGRDRLMTAEHINALITAHSVTPEPDLEAISHAASQTRAREQLDRILAREASRRTPRRA